MQAILRAAIIVGALAVSGAAFADTGSQTNGKGDGSNASLCGYDHGAFADVNGNFSILGQDGGTPGYHNGATGQDPGATGYNNSHTTCHTNNPS